MPGLRPSTGDGRPSLRNLLKRTGLDGICLVRTMLVIWSSAE